MNMSFSITKSICSLVKMGFWNVGGLKSKDSNEFNDPIFLKEIENFDLILLAETHLGPDCPMPSLSSYYFHRICREKSNYNTRYFGGLGILIRKCL
jgi:hypothetical protein